MKYNKIILAFFCFFILRIASAQENNTAIIDNLSAQLIKNIRSADKEQSFITTDKSLYAPGEDIWFRVFLLHSATQKINTSDKILYAELVNEKDTIISRLILDASTHQLTGKFSLPFFLQDGYYQIRAYTENMITSGIDKFSIQPVYVKNPYTRFTKMNTSTSIENIAVPEIDFYPEGGNIVTGATSRIAMFIHGKDRKPLSVNGYVLDGKDTAARFTSNEFGLADIEFEPSGYRKYVVVLNMNGQLLSYPLPAVNFYGAQVAVSSQKDGSKKVRVLLEDSIYKNDLNTYLLLVAKDSLWFASVGAGDYELTLPASKLPPGISTFFLYDKNLKLLSERNIYTGNTGASISANMDNSVYNKRSKASLTIAVNDAAGSPEYASISVAVTENHFIKPIDNNSLLTGCFQNNNEIFLNNLDLTVLQDLNENEKDQVMLIARNNFGNDQNEKTVSVNKIAVNIFNVSGIVTDKNNAGLSGKVISIISKSDDMIFQQDTTDANGRFTFHLPPFADSTKFLLQADKNRKESDYKIILDKQYNPRFTWPGITKMKFNLSQSGFPKLPKFYPDTSLDDEKVNDLAKVTVSTTEVAYDKSKRISSFSRIITSDKFVNASEGQVGSIVLMGGNLQIVSGYVLANGLTKMGAPDAGSEPIVIVDGLQVPINAGSNADVSPVLNFLNSLNPRSIDFVEVLTGPAATLFGLRGGNGVIVINTGNNQNNVQTDNKPANIETFYARGFYNAPLFKAPDYNNKKNIPDARSDLRTSLYWNGDILTDASGKATVSFYNNDVPGTYTATIRGVTVHGDIIYKTISYELK